MVLVQYHFNGSKMVQHNLRFPNAELHQSVKLRAKQEQISINKLVIKALLQYLNTPNSLVTQADLDPIRSQLAELMQKLKMKK